jgi:hypothetical protein
MDRDKRWDRVEIGLKGLVLGEGEESSDPVKTIRERYEKDPRGDEFLEPIIVGGKERRIQGLKTALEDKLCSLTLNLQMMTHYSSSTIAQIVSVKQSNSSETLTALPYPTSPIPRTLKSRP